MKKQTIKVATLLSLVAVGITACNPLNKMAKNASLVTYEVNPNPLEMHGDSVSISISGKYPAKYFHKKAIVTVTPTMMWEGGSKEFKSTTLVGEAAEGEGTKIPNAGGSFNFTDKIPYVKGMETCDVNIKAEGGFKTKKKEFSEAKIGDGTVVTPLLVQSDEKPILGKDKFIKVIPRSFEADVHYLINSFQVRSTELRADDYKELNAFLETGVKKEYEWTGVTVSSYASPDGELTKNENLANQRSEAAAKALARTFKSAKIDAAKEDAFFNKVGKGEDWDGFKAAVSATSHADKDLILRVLEMTTDLEKREQEIKNMSATFDFLRKEVLPQQRRSNITINANENARTDEEISALVKSSPDSLNIEEILYAATLTKDLGEKLSIYQTAQKIYADDWRGHNNAGYILLMQNDLNKAEEALNKADKAAPNNKTINNNLGIVARWKGDNATAMEKYNAAGSGKEVSYNKAIIQIIEGDYASAANNVSSVKSFNAALAHLLNGNADGVAQLVDASEAKETAEGYYLKAIAGARLAKNDIVIDNLKKAIDADGSLKTKAAGDAEFIKLKEDSGFQQLVN